MMKKILIVDDTLPNLQLLGSILRDLYSLSFASDGQEALDLLEHDIPDLILLDIMMPGIDGFEVCNRIRKNVRTHSIPIIFLSAKNDRESVIRGMGLGAQDYIVKPFLPEEVIKRISIQFPNKIVPQLNDNSRTVQNTDKMFLCNRVKNSHTAYELLNLGHLEDLSSIEERLDSLISNIPELIEYFKDIEEFLLKVKLSDPMLKKNLEEIQKKRITPELTTAIHTLHNDFQDCQFDLIDIINELNPNKANKVRNEIPSLKKLLTDLIHLLDNKIKLQWNIEKDLKLPYQKEDLIQVLLSLIDNAYDAMKGEENACSLQVEIKNYNLIISVKDTGPGIPLVAQDIVWESGFSSKEDRMGYGLTSAKYIVENHLFGSVRIPLPDKGQVDVVIPLA